jgi:hypothetical protein
MGNLFGSSGGGDNSAYLAYQQNQQANSLLDFYKQSAADQMAYQNRILADQEKAARLAKLDQQRAISSADTSAALQAGQQSEQQAMQSLDTQGKVQAVKDADALKLYGQGMNAAASAETGGALNMSGNAQNASSALAGAAGSIPGTQANLAGTQPTKNPVMAGIAGGATTASNPLNQTSQANSLFPNLNGIQTTRFGG